MQLALSLDDRHRDFAEIDARLRTRFGQPGPWRRLDPVSQLVMGLIGGRTHEADSRRAFEALYRRFGDWDLLRDAPVSAIHESIQEVTNADVKAERLKAALNVVTAARGRLTLDFLRGLPVQHALCWLERLPGVGRKTSAATLNFSTLQMPALVIDTHHRRVLSRLRLVGPRASIPQAYDSVVPYLPATWTADDLDDHHQLMKTLGQKICRHAAPVCRRCPLRNMCPTAASQRTQSQRGWVPPHSKLAKVRTRTVREG